MSQPDPIISIHIPKTAGTAFADVLTRNFGDAVGFYYGPDHPKTHPALRSLPRRANPETLAEIKNAGIKVIHGHFPSGRFRDAIPDPKNYWIWLRDPIERIISEYFFNKNRSDAVHPLAKALQEQNLSLTDYAKQKKAANLHIKHVRPFEIVDFGFVGITEFYDECVELSGLTPAPATERVQNATREKKIVAIPDRKTIARQNIADLALYSAALQRVMRDRRNRGQETENSRPTS